jgi:hypothetical protein
VESIKKTASASLGLVNSHDRPTAYGAYVSLWEFGNPVKA